MRVRIMLNVVSDCTTSYVALVQQVTTSRCVIIILYVNGTWTPQDFSNCIAQFPTPPDPPMTSTLLPRAFKMHIPPATFNALQTVRPV